MGLRPKFCQGEEEEAQTGTQSSPQALSVDSKMLQACSQVGIIAASL